MIIRANARDLGKNEYITFREGHETDESTDNKTPWSYAGADIYGGARKSGDW